MDFHYDRRAGGAMPQKKQNRPHKSMPGGGAGLSVTELGSLLESLYAGLIGPHPWQVFLDRLRLLFAAKDVTLTLRFPSRETGGAVVFSADVYMAEAEQAWNTHFFALDPFEGLPPEQVCSIGDVVSAERWRHSEVYRDYLRPLGIEHILAVEVHHPEGAQCRLRITRTAETGDFDPGDKATLRLLVAHLRAALGMQARLSHLESSQRLLAGTVDKLAVGSLLLDTRGELTFANDMARQLLDGRHGLEVVQQRLVAANARDNAALQKRLQKALKATPAETPTLVEAMSVGGSAREQRLSLLIRPVSGAQEARPGRTPAVAVFLRDAAGSAQASAALIRQLYALTPTETSVAMLLADGLSTDEVAQSLSISLNTVRVHLRAIFAKTGVDRQSALVRLLLNSVATLA